VFRAADMHDVLGLRSEAVPAGTEPLLEQMMSGGRRLVPPVTLESSRGRFERDLERLPVSLKDLDASAPDGPEVSRALRALADEATVNAKRAGGS